jgi:AraC-like DNA-binding protein
MSVSEVRQHSLRPGAILIWGDALEWSLVTNTTVVFAFVLGGGGIAQGRMLLTAGGGPPPPLGTFAAWVALDAPALSELLAGDESPGASRIRQFSTQAGAPPVVLPLTAAAQLAVESIRRCPFVGACRAVALHARGNDLLVEFLAALANTSAVNESSAPVVTRAHADRIHAAAARLRRDLEHPPALAELARHSGLSETSLKRGFRHVYGTTVFGYLRSLRMERARTLLASGEATVLEAAAQVGYSNPSNFAAAFRQEFGLNPKEFQLASRRP